jgi:asparagine synthase (glutamine-hydrolysing)
MCGIIATIGAKNDISEATVGRMLDSLRQRGPDNARSQHIGPCILGQARLSIVDIEGGVQPMNDPKLPITLVFNGEIYNFQETQTELKKRGHTFLTRSDTEVVLRAYVEWGEQCVDHLEGMFAFAIWDGRTNELFLARDRFGKKPLYYTQTASGTYLIASEIKALFATGLIKGNVSRDALESYLALLYVTPDRTIYENIHVLPPAHTARISNTFAYTQKRYWDMPVKPITDTYDEAKKRITTLLNDAVRSRMVVDVEIGSFLSGGVDSTFVSLIAAQQKHKIKTFSLGYTDGLNELPFALQASKAIGSDHHAFELTDDAADELITLMRYMDEPHADSSNFPQHLLSKHAAGHVRVALSGDGADEFFMGYGWYWKHAHLPFFKRWFARIFSSPFKQFITRMQIFTADERSKLLNSPAPKKLQLIPKNISEADVSSLQKITLWTSQVYLPGLLLTKIDRTSMMHSLEVRSPFLDRKLTEYVFNLPISYKCDVKKGTGKIILKDLLTQFMPKEFVYRRKEGFGAPLAQWLSSPRFQKLIDTTLLNKQNPMYRHLNFNECAALVKTYRVTSGQKKILNSHIQIWSLLSLAIWFQEHSRHHN